MAAPAPAQRATAILTGLGVARPSSVSVGLLVAWQACEQGPAQTSGHNPISTTWRTATSTTLKGNSAGVQLYPSEAVGIQATVDTFHNGDYPTIVKALKNGSASLFFSAAGVAEITRWGTRPTCIRGAYTGPVTPTAPSTSPPPRTLVLALVIGLPLLLILLTD